MNSHIFLEKILTLVSSFMLMISVLFLLSGCATKIESTKQLKKHKNLKATKYTSAARHKVTMRSYKVLGKRYYPCYVNKGQVMHGISSWYGPNFHGKYTSNGEVYNMHGRTAAHKTLPMDTMVKVTNKQNGKSTIVRINDRGPFVRGRIIDCSYTAGKEIGLDKLGIAKVKVEVLGVAGISSRNIVKQRKVPKKIQRVQGKYAVQVGAFSMQKGAEETKHKYATMYSQYKPVLKRFVDQNDKVMYRVLLLGFSSEEEARDFKYKNNLLMASSR